MAVTDLPLARTEVAETFFDRVAVLCDERGWSPAMLAAKAGLARGSMQRYRAERSAPRLDIAYRIAVTLDTTLDDLLDPRSPIAGGATS